SCSPGCPGTLCWLLSVCLLSWCCDAGVLRSVDPESELPTPLVIWSEEGRRSLQSWAAHSCFHSSTL
uniref:Uncharacterized protein n=1 Tax=Peromyscus maniculatus bairdii TaxID=230844 RepID=A0A8C8UF45_PERMB